MASFKEGKIAWEAGASWPVSGPGNGPCDDLRWKLWKASRKAPAVLEGHEDAARQCRSLAEGRGRARQGSTAAREMQRQYRCKCRCKCKCKRKWKMQRQTAKQGGSKGRRRASKKQLAAVVLNRTCHRSVRDRDEIGELGRDQQRNWRLSNPDERTSNVRNGG